MYCIFTIALTGFVVKDILGQAISGGTMGTGISMDNYYTLLNQIRRMGFEMSMYRDRLDTMENQFSECRDNHEEIQKRISALEKQGRNVQENDHYTFLNRY